MKPYGLGVHNHFFFLIFRIRSSSSQMLFKIVVLKNVAKLKGKEPVKKPGLQTGNLLKRDSNTGVFLWILRNF